MQGDVGVMIGFIAVASGACVLGMSYVGAFLLGRAHGRREIEREMRQDSRAVHAMESERLMAVEGAIDSMSRSVERLGDAQRIMLLAQDRPLSAEPRLQSPRVQGISTPA